MINQTIVPRRPALLIIMDGVGVNPCRLYNGVAMAHTPRLDEYFSRYPLTMLQASGRAVGLPDGQMGNSEVGHLTIGCGEIIRQDLVAINDAIVDGSFYENQILLNSINDATLNKKPVHLMGLVSDGGVHSHLDHTLALIDLCQRQGALPMLHMITDGRDTPPKCARMFLPVLEAALHSAGGKILTVSGRYYAMDRDNRWERIQAAWQALVHGKGEVANSAEAAIQQAYNRGQTDEFIAPTVVCVDHPVGNDDTVIFFNFRKDRARQMTSALFQGDFNEFDRGDFRSAKVTCMTEYDEKFYLPYAFYQDKPKTTLAEIISKAGLKQFHCAETEKYAHVTYFLNGRYGDAYPGEDRCIVPSPKVSTYDLSPAMSAAEVSDQVIRAIESGTYDFIAVNFANGDMVGHTGVQQSIIEAVECLDTQVGRVLDVAVEHNYSVVLTADHGNCEQMVDFSTGDPHTQHTVYPVPCLVVDDCAWQLGIGAGLTCIAPTILQLMGLEKPNTIASGSLLLTEIKKAG